ncbi:hypothetical protein [Pantoea agglomerans]|uniref:hypothetical protein n=1 Tax=Enterobacter agglomerans TaxID=549 RepID=UPI00117DA618|nr:hypothetical protein [Pantoea agglomerans]NKE95238.1 hypothetical protein [Pantoea agglomerans]TRO76776.1 hypothetical protein E5140_01260 [Pantoea agglomerans]
MDKSTFVMNFFREINDEAYPLETTAELLVQSIVDYVASAAPLQSNAQAIKEGIGLTILFKPFDLEVFCKGSYKLFEYQENIVSKCYQLHFFLKERDKDVTVLKVYITDDNHIVLDVYGQDSICDASKENKGMRVFNLLLRSLYENGIIKI